MTKKSEFSGYRFHRPDSDPEFRKLTLLPCPFCGSTNVAFVEEDHPAGKRWGVGCLNCMAMLCDGTTQGIGEARTRWNIRYGFPPVDDGEYDDDDIDEDAEEDEDDDWRGPGFAEWNTR